MRVCILGPVSTDRYFGGVAAFDEGLLRGFTELGADARLLTLQEGELRPRDPRIERTTLPGLRALARSWRPDLYVASLQYGALYLVPGLLRGGRRAYCLHGFFNRRDYRAPRALLGAALQRAVAAASDAVVANSAFTAEQNAWRFKIRVDGVAEPGVGAAYLDAAASLPEKEPGSVLFAGRLVAAKRADVVVRAVAALRARGRDVTLTIAGDGPERDRLAELVRGLPFVRMAGRVAGERLRGLYLRSEVFVSLNDAEPFGIAYAEALCCGCKVVAPATGGQVGFLSGHADRARLVGRCDAAEVARAVGELLGAEAGRLPAGALERFGYARCARDLAAIAGVPCGAGEVGGL